MSNWLIFIGFMIATYICISMIGMLTGSGAATWHQAALRGLSPAVIFLSIFGNILFGTGLFFGFGQSSHAISISIAIGIIVSFIFGVVVLGATFTAVKAVGLALIIGGVYFLAI